MSWPYRCTRTSCRARRALRKPIEHYSRRPICRACGQDSLKLDAWKKADHKTALCRCGQAHWYPHRRGSYGCRFYTGTRRPDRSDWGEIDAQLGVSSTVHGAESAPF